MDYKETLNLPQTSFPMKANLPVREVEILKKWEEDDLYQSIRDSRRDDKKFMLHDGPPYANGNIHAGTALNKILKDIIVKAKTMQGYDSPYVPGWDCHGLPIELNVDKKLGKKKREMTKTEIRSHCRQFAKKFVGIQKDEFKRLGVLGDWDKPYLTINDDYELGIAREFSKFIENGALYRANKPVHWCPSCVTALAEAEVEHSDHTSPSVFVKFRLTDESATKLGLSNGPVYAVIWTTTPWTLPANMAITLHPDFEYSAIKSGDETFIIASDLVESSMKIFGADNYEIVKTIKGAEFENLSAIHPFAERESKLILGDHVTLEQGTGLVHTAPGHGMDDYIVGLKYGLEVYNPVNQYGVFVEGTPHVAGLKVWKANEAVIELLQEQGDLLAREDISHSYPHCWRCRGPIIFRATPQWFISMQENNLRDKSLTAIRKVDWTPKWGEERIFGMVENRPDWCVSRQRVWGVPVLAFECQECDGALLSKEVADHVLTIFEDEGIDAWFDKSASELLPDGAKCPDCGGGDLKQSSDILDVWFDSGVSHSVVVNDDDRLTWPSDLYLEGSDQHRGWFHTSLLCSVGTTGKAPYRQVLTHGYVVDGAGKKMSKSLGNTIAPQKIIDRYGAEIVRLWVASEDYREDIRLSDTILQRLTEAYRKIRNTTRFMLGNLYDFDPAKDTVPVEERPELDRFILMKFDALAKKIVEAYERYDFHIFYHAIHNFCVVDLSSFYLDIVKDRAYTFPKESVGRRAAQSTMNELATGMLKLMAPVLSFTAEEAYGHLPGSTDKRSVHLARFPEPSVAADEKLIEEWERLIIIRGEVLKVLENARREKMIGHPLDAKVTLSAFKDDYALLTKRNDFLPFLFIVSQVTLSADPIDEKAYKSDIAPGLSIMVEKAAGLKCPRCWNYSLDIGKSDKHPDVCGRCATHL